MSSTNGESIESLLYTAMMFYDDQLPLYFTASHLDQLKSMLLHMGTASALMITLTNEPLAEPIVSHIPLAGPDPLVIVSVPLVAMLVNGPIAAPESKLKFVARGVNLLSQMCGGVGRSSRDRNCRTGSADGATIFDSDGNDGNDDDDDADDDDDGTVGASALFNLPPEAIVEACRIRFALTGGCRQSASGATEPDLQSLYSRRRRDHSRIEQLPSDQRCRVVQTLRLAFAADHFWRHHRRGQPFEAHHPFPPYELANRASPYARTWATKITMPPRGGDTA